MSTSIHIQFLVRLSRLLLRLRPVPAKMSVTALRPVDDRFLAVLVHCNDTRRFFVTSHLSVSLDWVYKFLVLPVDTQPD